MNVILTSKTKIIVGRTHFHSVALFMELFL